MASASLSTANTLAPSCANSTAVARPLPQPGPTQPAPVTMATLSARRPGMASCCSWVVPAQAGTHDHLCREISSDRDHGSPPSRGRHAEPLVQGPHQFGLMPAACTTLPHLSISLLIKAANSSGLLPDKTAPWLNSFSFTSGLCIASTAILLSLAMMAGGVPAGATMPYQLSAKSSGNPTSAVVGTSFTVAWRSREPSAMGRIFPACTCG